MLPYMFTTPCYFPLYFRLLALMIFMITLVQSFKPPSNNNINNNHSITSHIFQKLTSKFHMNYSLMEPVLFEKFTTLNCHDQFSE